MLFYEAQNFFAFGCVTSSIKHLPFGGLARISASRYRKIRGAEFLEGIEYNVTISYYTCFVSYLSSTLLSFVFSLDYSSSSGFGLGTLIQLAVIGGIIYCCLGCCFKGGRGRHSYPHSFKKNSKMTKVALCRMFS